MAVGVAMSLLTMWLVPLAICAVPFVLVFLLWIWTNARGVFAPRTRYLHKCGKHYARGAFRCPNCGTIRGQGWTHVVMKRTLFGWREV